MDNKRLKRALGGAIPLAILITGISYNSYVKIHTFTLSGSERVKSEEIQPVSGSVKIEKQLNLNGENGTGLKGLENLQ